MTGPDVPYLKQKMIGSCGPACVQMVCGWLRSESTVLVGSEMVPWARSWIFPFGMTESFGLARLLRDVGAEVTVYKERPGFSLHPAGDSPMARMFRVFGLGASPVARWRTVRALGKGVEVVLGPVTLELLDANDPALLPAIIMVNQGVYAPDPDWPEGVLHWVVVTGIDPEHVRFHDPDLGPDQEVGRPVFERAMDVRPMGIDRQMVVARPGASLPSR
ncbi:MAG: peptidase C39 family protein [Thermoplasmata archaeon]|nr:peptidase C39 family protein [Thermoplasmata archaeon]